MAVKERTDEELEDMQADLPWVDNEEGVTAIDDDMHYILMDKFSGSALEKAHSVNPCQSIKAVQRLWVWFGCMSKFCSGYRCTHRCCSLYVQHGTRANMLHRICPTRDSTAGNVS